MRLASLVLLLTLCGAALALQPVPRSPLLTPPTFVDESGYGRDLGDRVIDTRTGQIECVTRLAEGPFAGSPEAAARAFLARHTDWVGLTPTTDNLRVLRVAESPMGHHVTFVRTIHGVPVYPGELVVTLDKQSMVRFYYSNLFAVPESTPATAALPADEAVRVAYNYLNPRRFVADHAPATDLVIWAGDNRDFAPCWKVRQFFVEPRGDWEVLVDANTGAIRRVADRLCYIDGTGSVFKPDPVTTAQVNYGGSYVDGSDATNPQLHAQVFIDTLREITLTGGTYSLSGPHISIRDWDPPTQAPVTATHPDSFRFNRNQQGFEDANVYFHIDGTQRWIQSLGFDDIQNLAMWVDPHGVDGDDNAYYVPALNRIAFGEGGVDDAEDADVVLHEYGHAIQHGINPNWGAGGDAGAMGEGFGDYWAGSSSRVYSDYHHSWVFNWDGHNPFWPGRNLDVNYHYPEDMGGGIHDEGQIWSRPCYEVRIDVGRDVMDEIVLQHHYLIGGSATMPAAAQAIVTADENLNAGANAPQIYARFVPRGLLTQPPVFALLGPVGGELWPVDSTVAITWSTGALGGDVSLELSRAGSAGPWESIAATTPNDGNYSLTVTGPASNDCFVRVAYLGTPAQADTSATAFIIDRVSIYTQEGFETGAAGWTHSFPQAPWIDEWHLSTETAHGGTTAFKCGNTGNGNYNIRNNASLYTPVIENMMEGAVLEFWHQMDAEIWQTADSANDGGILEVAVNGGPWTQLFPSTGGYNSQIRGGIAPSGPFARSTRVWSGSIAWTKVMASLGQFAGNDVQVRWRFGSNAGVGREGWYVDDVRILGPYTVPAAQPVTVRRIGDEIILRWPDSGAAHYRVYGSATYEGPYDTLVGTVETNSLTLPIPAEDGIHFFIVKGWDGQDD